MISATIAFSELIKNFSTKKSRQVSMLLYIQLPNPKQTHYENYFL